MKLTYNDRDHAYWLDGRRVKSASTVAKIAADSFTIDQWRKRQVAIGMTLDRKLAEEVAVDPENRETINDVCERAMEAAKANNAARRGTQRHRVFELLLLGREDMFITDQQKADAEVLRRTLDAYGLEPIPERVEQFVAWPENWIVGRYDAVLMHEGRPVLCDLKSGENAIAYPHSTAVQLALYLFAPLTSKTVIRNGDKSTVEEWTTMPDGIDTETAYVIYASDDHDVGELWRVNMTHGLVGAHLALDIVDWRRKHFAYIDGRQRPTEEFVARVDRTLFYPSELSIGPDVAQTPPPPEVTARVLAQLRMANDAARAREPVRLPPDEGAPVTDEDFKPLKDAYDRLPPVAVEWFKHIITEATAAGVDFRAQQNKTVRRYEIYRGLIRLGLNGWLDDAQARGFVEEATKDDAVNFSNVTLGHAIGSMGAAEAATFSKLIDANVGEK